MSDPNYLKPGDEQVNIEFTEDGRATYTIIAEDSYQIINLTYTVEGNIIVTNQPSNPNIEHTEFSVIGDQLILKYGNQFFYYMRMD